MFRFLKHKSVALVAVAVCASGSALIAETAIDEMEQYFAVASKHYGDGQVQVHTRRDNDEGSQHSVLTINCKEQTYRRDYDGDEPPEQFPLSDYEEPNERLTGGDAVATAAVHSCEEHGHPLLEWRW